MEIKINKIIGSVFMIFGLFLIDVSFALSIGNNLIGIFVGSCVGLGTIIALDGYAKYSGSEPEFIKI